MSDIAPISRPASAEFNSSATGGVSGRSQPIAAPFERGQDRVELSTTAQLLAKIADLPNVRQDVIDRVRTEIDLGIYETDDKLNTAIDALADDLV